MVNVLFFPFGVFPTCFERELEIMQRELDKGNNIYVLFCEGSFCQCEMTARYDFSKDYCSKCITIRKQIKNVLREKNGKINLVPFEKYKIPNNIYISSIKNIDEGKNLKYEDYNIGYGILSSLAEKFDKLGFENISKLSEEFIFSNIKLYDAIKEFLKTTKIDIGYIHNGRLASSATFIAALKSEGVPVFVHEQGGARNKFIITDSVFAPDSWCRNVKNEWNDKKKSVLKKKKIAKDFFYRKVSGKKLNNYTFTQNQIQGLMPENFFSYKRRIVIYNSSSFEFDYSGPEYTYKMYKSQYDGIKRICEELEKYKELGVFIREHPHLKDMDNQQRRELRSINFANTFLIPAESPISSYSLLFNADVVVTFNSTMGIEATYWGKPSICCSNAIYEKLDVAYMPNTHEEIINLILNENLKARPKDDAEKIGYYFNNAGIKFKYYKTSSSFYKNAAGYGTFRGYHFFLEPKTKLFIRKLSKLIIQWLNKITGKNLKNTRLYKKLKEKNDFKI